MKLRTLLVTTTIACITLSSTAQVNNGETTNTKKGVEATVSQQWFKMGDLRLINNDWGSQENGCTSSYRIFIENDGSFGWDFNRSSCGGVGGDAGPDYPEIEFGIHPFGVNKDMVTSPDFCSTDLLPIQIKDVTSASITIDQMSIQLQNAASWNMNFETWFTSEHPVTGNHSCPQAEVMVFWGWQDGRWACDQSGTATSGNDSYQYCHDASGWGCGWRYMQFRLNGGPKRDYSGKLDVKAILDWLVNNKGISSDLWISRFEIGTEIGDNTSGKVTIKNLTFEVNGQSRSPEFFDPTATKEPPREVVSHKQPVTVFPAGTTVEIVNMQGARQTVRTGMYRKTAAELGKQLPRGVYLMYGIDRNGNRAKNAVVVPVL